MGRDRIRMGGGRLLNVEVHFSHPFLGTYEVVQFLDLGYLKGTHSGGWYTVPYEVFTLPGLIHMESMWNPWNECWLRPQPIHCSMDIMDSMWNDHGMVNSIWNPLLFHPDSTGFHMEFRHIHHGFHGQVHMDSMD